MISINAKETVFLDSLFLLLVVYDVTVQQECYQLMLG